MKTPLKPLCSFLNFPKVIKTSFHSVFLRMADFFQCTKRAFYPNLAKGIGTASLWDASAYGGPQDIVDSPVPLAFALIIMMNDAQIFSMGKT